MELIRILRSLKNLRSKREKKVPKDYNSEKGCRDEKDSVVMRLGDDNEFRPKRAEWRCVDD